MKLIMENWRNFLIEREIQDPIHRGADAYTKYAEKDKGSKAFLEFLTWHVDRLHSSPADLKGVITMLVRGYNKNEAIKKAEASISSNKMKKIDKAIKTIKDISRLEDNKEIKWKFTDACKEGVWGSTSCTLGSVVSRYDRLENTTRVLQFSMMKRSDSSIQRIRNMAVDKLKPFIRTTPNRKDAAKVHHSFINFVEVLLSIYYSCTYVHELYHYYEFSKEFKHETEEWSMAKYQGYRNPKQEMPKKFVGGTARTTAPAAELRAIQVEEDYLKVLSSSLPIHIKKTEKFPGYIGSWAKNPEDNALEAALDKVFEETFADVLSGQAEYRKKQHYSLHTLFNNKYAWKTVAPDIKPAESGPYAQKNQKFPDSSGLSFTSTGQIQGPGGKALTGRAAKLPRIKRRGDPRSD